MRNPAGQLAHRLHLLRLAQRLFRGRALGQRLRNALLERGVESLQLAFRVTSLRDLLLRSLEQVGVVHGHRRLAGEADNQLFRSGVEDSRLLVPEEQTAQHLSSAGAHRHGEIAADRQMPLRHPVVGFAVSVPGVCEDVGRPHHALAREGRREHLRVPRHRKLRERLPRRA